jgi:hypothetical protein
LPDDVLAALAPALPAADVDDPDELEVLLLHAVATNATAVAATVSRMAERMDMDPPD